MNTYHCSPADSKTMGEEGRGQVLRGDLGVLCLRRDLRESGFTEKLLGTACVRRLVLERGDIGAWQFQ